MTTTISARLACAALALLIASAGVTLAEDAARPARSLDAFQHFSYAYAAGNFNQKGWFGAPGGNAERIAIHIEDPESGILIELPPGVGPEAERQVTSVLRDQGWKPGSPANIPAGNGPIFSYSLKQMTRVTGWNRSEVRLNVDELVGALRKLGGRPLFLCVRTAKDLDFRATPAPRAAGLFNGFNYAFYRLRDTGNGILVVRYGVPVSSLSLAALSAVFWLFAPLALTALILKWGKPNARAARAANAATFVPLITSVGAYVSLYLQNEVLRLIRLPASGIPPPYDRLGFWLLPYCIFLYLWATLLVARWTAVRRPSLAPEQRP